MKLGYEDISSIEAHKNIIKAMKETNVKRLIYWSTPSIKYSEDKASFVTIIQGIMASLFLSKAKKVLIGVNKIILVVNTK